MRPLIPVLLAGCLAALAGCTTPSGTDSGGARPAGAGGEKLTIGLMPKQKGIPYFNAVENGALEAAQELGDVELVYNGPLEDRSEQQSSMLDTWIVSRYDAIAVACNDPNQIASSLSRARDAGTTVVTYDADADAESSRRQFFVNQVDAQAISRVMVDQMARQAGEDAEVAVVSSSPTAPNQSAWLKAMDAYMKEKYPRMRVVVTEYAGENQVTSNQKSQNILKTYPNVKGIWGMTSVAFPGAAQAVEQAGKTGQVKVIGLGTPNVMREFLDRGVVENIILWNPIDLGYLTVHVTRAVARGELQPGSTEIEAGRLGTMKVDGDQVLLGDPMVFDKSNIDQFDF